MSVPVVIKEWNHRISSDLRHDDFPFDSVADFVRRCEKMQPGAVIFAAEARGSEFDNKNFCGKFLTRSCRQISCAEIIGNSEMLSHQAKKTVESALSVLLMGSQRDSAKFIQIRLTGTLYEKPMSMLDLR